MQFEIDVGIEIVQPIAGRFQFASPYVFCSVKDLPLQIGKIDIVEIDQPNRAYARCCQI